VAAARRWGSAHDVAMVDADAVIAPYLARGEMNPDGMHWTWASHADVARAMAAVIRDQHAAG
ncbi:MAG: hypothetical protein LC640_13710, partial [Frankia sp.]|nr:hypothetical protein [Frankia sp.]